MLHGIETNSMKHTWRISERLTNTNRNIPPLQFTIYGKTTTIFQGKLNDFVNSLEGTFATNWDVDRTFRVSPEKAVTDFPRQPLAERAMATNLSKIT
jgi:hypothetical protein